MATEEVIRERWALVEKRQDLICQITHYDRERNRNEKAHQQRQAELKEKLFADIELLGEIQRKIYLIDLVALCNTPNLFAPIV